MSLENCSYVSWKLQGVLSGLVLQHVQAQIQQHSNPAPRPQMWKLPAFLKSGFIAIIDSIIVSLTVPQCIPIWNSARKKEMTGHSLWCPMWHIYSCFIFFVYDHDILSAEDNTRSVATLHTLLQALLLNPNLKPLIGFQGKAFHLKHSSRAKQWWCSTRCLAQGGGHDLQLERSDAEPLYCGELQSWKHRSTQHLHMPGGWQGAKFGKGPHTGQFFFLLSP